MRYAAILLLVGASLLAHADRVELKPTTTGSVNIRPTASTDQTPIGTLVQGQSLSHNGSVPFWHGVLLPDGREGFTSKQMTRVVDDPVMETAAWAVHFVDVGTGDGAIIDMGDLEIVIDGGNFVNTMRNYIDEHDLIQSPIELVIVTHADTDHWKGLTRLLGYDGVVDAPPAVLEFWEPGHSRDCRPQASYDAFITNVQANVPVAGFKRPLESHHQPATVSGTPAPLTLPSLPGVAITVLHTEDQPTATDCSYRINNASIVTMIEIDGVRFLFTGDANGKERAEASPGTPGHVEQQLLTLEAAHPGTLSADVLKAPHHESETASTQAFVDAVDPDFVIISASTISHLRVARSPVTLSTGGLLPLTLTLRSSLDSSFLHRRALALTAASKNQR